MCVCVCVCECKVIYAPLHAYITFYSDKKILTHDESIVSEAHDTSS